MTSRETAAVAKSKLSDTSKAGTSKAGTSKAPDGDAKPIGELPQVPLTIMRADGSSDVFEGYESKWTWNIRVDGCLEIVRSWWNTSSTGDSLRVREVVRVYNRDAWQQVQGGDIRHFPVEATRASDL
ncbi:MAG TPA: hypothetical protein VNA12_06730 [Mycobacteriales bacterium]|nr:hypothetical protein [Mycobacteriales bacterium]